MSKTYKAGLQSGTGGLLYLSTIDDADLKKLLLTMAKKKAPGIDENGSVKADTAPENVVLVGNAKNHAANVLTLDKAKTMTIVFREQTGGRRRRTAKKTSRRRTTRRRV